jgi:hypothetical protein
MASLLIKNIPPRLHAQLKKRAAAHRRSLNSETILVLEEAIRETAFTPDPIPPQSHEGTWKEILARLPPEAAQRLQALRSLQLSVESRDVDIESWMQTARESRR